jgi:hypothetical protein
VDRANDQGHAPLSAQDGCRFRQFDCDPKQQLGLHESVSSVQLAERIEFFVQILGGFAMRLLVTRVGGPAAVRALKLSLVSFYRLCVSFNLV